MSREYDLSDMHDATLLGTATAHWSKFIHPDKIQAARDEIELRLQHRHQLLDHVKMLDHRSSFDLLAPRRFNSQIELDV